MFCPRCGTQNADDAAQCSQCGTALQTAGTQASPEQAPQPQQPPTSQMPPQPQWQQPQMPVSPMATPVNLTMSWVLAAVSALCCCLPLGIAGIVFAAQANTRIAQGDYAAAAELAKKSNMFSIIGLVIGAIGAVIYFILAMMSVVSGGAAATGWQ